MLTSWVLFPLVLAALCVGWGWLLALVLRVRIPGALVPCLGMAGLVVAGQFLTYADFTAELTTPLLTTGAAVGLVLGIRRPLSLPPARPTEPAGYTAFAHAALLHVPVAAKALKGLGGHRRGALHTQYLATAVASRRRAASAGRPGARSKARATRMASMVAASDSTARSARTLVISGWSASRRPKARGCAASWVAWATRLAHQRRPPDDAASPGVSVHLEDRGQGRAGS